MSEREERRMTAARHLVAELRDLGGAEPPAALAPAILRQVGLADAYVPIETPLGRMFVAFNDVGISAVGYAPTAADFARDFRQRFGRAVAAADKAPTWLARALDRQRDGARQGAGRVKPRLDLRGLSEFERAVLLKALEIPPGEVRTYSWVAREIGHPKAMRAVGTALARNPIPLFIPCHRVVRSDGHLGRYTLLNDDAKRTILAAEGLDPDALEALARQGVRYLGSDSTHIY
ncbi:MAG: MGMT family protein, partial [Ktedonobacterales bacterium]|nr:MGMT family protein [Ktedonobacterales bacterium]